MNLPWQTRKPRRRQEIGEKLQRERLADLRAARDAALLDVEDAKARRGTRGHHEALKRAHVATHALMQAEVQG